jgi:type VI secretion system protein ImpF
MPPLIDPSQGLMPSIVDRLVDPLSAGTDARRGYSLSQMLESVRRDLEDLLNTRQTHTGLPPQLTRVGKSMVTYGLPDLTTFTVTSVAAREDMARKLEAIISQHEPRLKDIRVILSDVEEGNKQSVRCRIEARFALDPAPEVSFDTLMEPLTGQHKVRQAEA